MSSSKVLFCLVGYPGAGKSTFAKELDKIINAEYISADKVAKRLFPLSSYPIDQYLEKREVILRQVQYEVGDALSTSSWVICDANVSTRELRGNFSQIAKNSKAEMVLVWLQTPLEIAEQRAIRPRDLEIGSRKVKQEVSSAIFDLLVSIFEPPGKNEKPVVISGLEQFPEQLREFKKQLKQSASKGVAEIII